MNYLVPFIISVIISILFTILLKNLALKYRWGMLPVRGRDIHKRPTPRLGGVAIFSVFWIIVIVYWCFFPEKLSFSNEKILGLDKNLLGVLIASMVWIIVGIIDDFRGIKPVKKFFAQGICGLIIIAFGIKIWWLSSPTGGLDIIIGNWNWLLVPAWIGLMMNVVNWLDGIDGLTSGISIIALIVLFVLSIEPSVNQPATALLCVILAGSILGFLFFNWHPAKIFLGDSGSMFIGLILGVISIISGAKLATAVLVLGIPILDSFWVMLQRLTKKKSIWSADKIHLHHRFLQAGFSVKQTVVIFYAIAASFGIIALQSETAEKIKAIWYLLIIMVIIIVVLSIARHFKIKNNDEP